MPEPTATPNSTSATPTPEPTATAARELPALPFDSSVVRGALSNGLSYYIKHNEEPRNRAQIALAVRAGSIHEEESQRGLAHFVEHMAFNGTERFAKQEIIDYLESVGSSFGPDLNARTGFDDTLYFFEIPTDDPEVTETAFQILSDWAYGIAFDPDEVELERDVVLEEWRLYQGFNSRLEDNLLQLLFGSTLYVQRTPIGLPEVIEAAPPQLLRDYYERWYRPDLMAVIAIGDFDVEAVEAKIVEHFAPPPEGEASQDRAAVASPTSRPVFDVQSHEDPWIEVFTDAESPGTQFVLIRKLPPDRGQDYAAFRRFVVERLAFMMLNARLDERGQVEDPPYLFAQAGRSSYVEPLDIVTFSAWVESGGIESGLAAVLEEIQRVHQHGFTVSELDREKSNLLRLVESLYKQRDQVPSQNFVDEYVDHFLTGTPAPGIEAEWALYQELLPQISLDAFDEVTASWTRLEDTSLLIVRPAETESLSDEQLHAATLAQLETADALEVTAYADDLGDVPLLATIPTPGSITSEEQIESIDALKWTLSNGITVIAKQTDFRDDEVVFTAFSPGGHSLVDDDDYASATYAAGLIGGSGVGDHDSVTLDKLLAGKRVSVSPFIDELFEGLRGSASPDDMETLFQLITLYATQPRMDPVFFERYEASLRSVAETNAADPDSVLFDTARTVLAQNHFRARPLTVALLDELSMERAEAVYDDRFADLGDATFVFVGAFDWNTLRSLAATYLASLPATGRAEQWSDRDIDPPTGVEDHIVRKGIEPRSNTVLVFAGDMEWSRQEAFNLNAAGEMLGIRLRERVREELGGTYAIGVNAGSSSLPDPEYRMSVIFGSDPSRTEELFGEVLEEVEWLRTGGEQEYLDKVKELLRSSREEQLRENGFWLSQIRAVGQRGEPFSEIIGFDALLEALALEDIAEAAERYFTDDRYVRVVLFPEESGP
ncbi:MAG: insulinase family protein [Chloroflexota bacterium]|nr:insulinase family protein [Chloroflexota bacterium]